VIYASRVVRSLKLTTAVTCPTFRIHPTVLAQATSMTAVLAPGRFAFGIGSGLAGRRRAEGLPRHLSGTAGIVCVLWPDRRPGLPGFKSAGVGSGSGDRAELLLA
jgi:hypothetical protein